MISVSQQSLSDLLGARHHVEHVLQGALAIARGDVTKGLPLLTRRRRSSEPGRGSLRGTVLACASTVRSLRGTAVNQRMNKSQQMR
jgi:hypothetical protein